MSDQPSEWQTPPPQPPTPTVDTSEPMTSVQTQIGLVLTAAATVVTFVFHKDFSSIVPALSVIAFAIYGASAAIARAWKHSTVIKAQAQMQSLALDTWATRRRDTNESTASRVALFDHRLRTVEAKLATPAKKTAKKTTTRPRRKAPPL